MEIEHAVITIHDFNLIFFDPGSEWSLDNEGKWLMTQEGCIINGKEAEKIFLTELRDGMHIYNFSVSSDGCRCIEAASASEPWFEVRFTFTSLSIEWNEYSKTAWYEETSQ